MLPNRFSECGWLRLLGAALAILALCGPQAKGSSTSPSVSLAWERNLETDIVGYKIYWGEVSRQYTRVLDVANTPAAVLTNLEAGKTYHCAVTAYNGSSQESSFSQEVIISIPVTEPGTPDPSGRLVRFEAENGQLGAPMAVFTGPSESWVDTSSYSQLGWTRSTVEIPVAGDYHLWCRVKAPSASNDSFFVMMDEQPEEVFHVYGTPTPPEGTRTSAWTWRRIHVTDGGPRVHALDQGAHTLRFRVREPGTLLDRVVLSSDPAFVPNDSLPRSGDALAVTRAPLNESKPAGGAATFWVTAAASGPVSYQWRKDGTVIPGATSAILVLDPVQATDEGSYTVTLTSGSATITTDPALLTVTPPVGDQAFRVARMTFNPDRTVDFELTGELNANILVYASGDLVNWALVGSRTNTTGRVQVSDPAAVGESRRFYRLVSEAIPEE